MLDDKTKIAAVAVLFAAALLLGYYFLFYPNQNSFVPGNAVTVDDFKTAFISATDIHILMDIRGVKNANTTQNIMECGVDFAGSSGMGGKNVTYFVAASDGCTSIDSVHPISYCFTSIQKGLTIYVKEGNITSYYSNGMVVGVGPIYKVGTCGIKVVG